MAQCCHLVPNLKKLVYFQSACLGVGRIFFRGVNSGFFKSSQQFLFMVPKLVKFHFTHSKLRKLPFFLKKGVLGIRIFIGMYEKFGIDLV